MSSQFLYFLSFSACLLFASLFSFGLLPSKLEEIAVAEKGSLVTVELLRSSRARFSKRPSYYLHFLYKGNEYSANVGANFFNKIKHKCTIQLRHLSEYPQIFFQPEHSEQGQLFSTVVIISALVIGAIYSFIKMISGAAGSLHTVGKRKL